MVEAGKERAMPASRSKHDKAVDALMTLAAETPLHDITLPRVAAAAGMSLADLRGEYRSLGAVFAAFLDRIDAAMLKGLDKSRPEDTVRDRIFDVIMRRLEALGPYKPALRNIVRDAGREPGLALRLFARLVHMQGWILEAAGGSARGLKGRAYTRGLALVYGRVFRVWLEEDDPGLTRTMAALDRGLRRGESWAEAFERPLDFADGLAGLTASLATPRHRWRRRGPAANDVDAA